MEPNDEFSYGREADPVTIAGMLLVILFVSVVGFNVLSGLTAGEEAVALAETPTAPDLPTANPSVTWPAFVFEPAATEPVNPVPTQPPTEAPANTQEQRTDGVIALPTITPHATMTPLPPTAIPTIVPTPQPKTEQVSEPQSGDRLGDWQPPVILPTPIPGGDYAARVPILMYHYVSHPPADADKYRLDLSTRPEQLREQLTFLQNNGYTTVSLYDVALAISNQAILPPNPVVLTFDDGHLDNYWNAFPLLVEFGMTATFFVITDLPDIQHPDYMSWSMIEEMAAAGMDIEIHTKSHRDMTSLKRETVINEVLGSQEIIAWHTKRFPRFIAYPGGSYGAETVEILREETDVWGAVSTEYGYTHEYRERFTMKRVRMRYTTTLGEFAALLVGETAFD